MFPFGAARYVELLHDVIPPRRNTSLRAGRPTSHGGNGLVNAGMICELWDDY